MRGQGHGHGGIADVDVGMMVGGVGRLGHAVHEPDPLGEFLELVGLHDRVALPLPARQLRQSRGHFSSGQFRHRFLLT